MDEKTFYEFHLHLHIDFPLIYTLNNLLYTERGYDSANKKYGNSSNFNFFIYSLHYKYIYKNSI